MFRFKPARSALRTTGLIHQTGDKVRSLRCIHESHNVRASARPSPRVRAQTQQPTTIRVKKTYDVEASLPPVVLLDSASKSGAMSITSGQALRFLEEYLARSITPSLGSEQKLCADHSIDPATVTLLASITGKCQGKGQQALGRKLMFSASAMGDRSATFQLVSAAIKKGNFTDYAVPLRRIGLLAKHDNDPQAMTLMGQMLYSQRQERAALDWFRKATQSPSGNIDFEGAGEALVTQGRILLELKDNNGAKAAFETAALKLDDPNAYFYLSQLEEPGSTNQEVYLLKAATSGVIEAYHNLGARELARLDKRGVRPKKVEDYGMAREWFEVAAADGFGLSMLNLASMFKAVGSMETGERWLEEAEGVPEVQDQARDLRRTWLDSEPAKV